MRKAFTLLQAVVVIAGLVILAAVIFPIFGRARESDCGRNPCPSNLKQINLGMMQYVQDYTGKYPLATQNSDWMDVLQPYLKSTQIFQCPKEATAPLDGPTDYFYNSRLAGKPSVIMPFLASTILNGDGLGTSPTSAYLSALPSGWANDSNSPAWRHEQGANYSFADGHVKMFKPSEITTDPPAPANHTFAVK